MFHQKTSKATRHKEQRKETTSQLTQDLIKRHTTPAGKVFSFGHPNVDVLLDHFRGCVVGHNNTNLDESYTKLHVQMLNKSYTEVNVNCWQYLIFVSLLFFDFDIEYYINVSQFMDILNKFIIRGFIRR